MMVRPTWVFSIVAVALAAAAPTHAGKTKPAPRETQAVLPIAPSSLTGARLRSSATLETASGVAVDLAPQATCGGAPIAGSSVRTYGYVDSISGNAVINEVWTFDHDGGSWEGWRRDDLTENDFTAFQRITAGIWSAHPNLPPAPIISGLASIWLGFHEDEADAACWEAGLGYGNNWAQRMRSPLFVNTIGDSVSISFDYWYDCEPGYDFVKVIVQSAAGVRTTIATFTGQSGSYGAPLSFSQKVAVPDSFRLFIEFTSDVSYSDEDDLYSTFLGAFGMDNVNIVGLEGTVGGPPPPYNFDLSLQGWFAGPIPGVGSQAAINDFAGYLLTGCGQSGNVISFHNGSDEHPPGQHERVTTPPADVSSYGTAPLNVWAQYDIYADNAQIDSLVWTWGFQYFPYVCPATGDSIWSPPAGSPYYFYSNSVLCTTIRSFANDTTLATVEASGTTLIPAGVDSVRFFLDVLSTATTPSGDVSPLFDNISIGVSNATAVLHVPTPMYPDIQSGIDAAGLGDTVVVRAGVYTGPTNRDLDFDGTDRVLISEEGPSATVIDCEQAGRAFYFHSAESAASVVDGFALLHGTQAVPGALLLVNSSSPTFRNCYFNKTTVIGSAYGVLRVNSGSPYFECCTVAEDTTQASGGAVRINGGGPVFDTCTIGSNSTMFSCVSLVGGTPTMIGCEILSNVTTYAVIVSTAATMTGCNVFENSGVGMYFYPASASVLTACSIHDNASGGIGMESNSSTFLGCLFQGNSGPGIVITSVSSLSSGATPRSSAVPTATSPYFSDCTISGNVNTSSSGGGVLFDCSNVPSSAFTPIYENCTITGNASLFSGGGIAVCGYALYTDIAPVFQNCTISANAAGANGGGIYVAADNGGGEVYWGYVTMDRTIMWGNCSDGMGNEAYMESSNFLSFDCSNVDTLGVDGTGDIIYGPEQTYDNPGFCGPAECTSSGTISGNFTIEVGSPADSANSPCGQLIGASPPVCTPGSGVGDGSSVPAQTALWQNIPNPFNPSTTIRFDLAVSGRVSLAIYNVRGQLVRRLVDRHMSASRHAVSWNGTDDRGRSVASGIYFARLVAGDVAETRKMLLLK